MLHYHTGLPVPNDETMSMERQHPRERSLSPDSLEQRLFQQQHLMADDLDNDESLLSSSSSFIESISTEQQAQPARHAHSSASIFKTLSSHGLLNTLSFQNEIDDFDDDDLDDLDEIQLDQDDANVLFSDPDDGILCRLPTDFIDIDDDYDTEHFCVHIRPLPLLSSPNVYPSKASLSLLIPRESQVQYSPRHSLDPISEAASEDERRAAISTVAHLPQKHKHSSSSSLSPSAHRHCCGGGSNDDDDGDTTTATSSNSNDDLSTLSDPDEQNISMHEASVCQPTSSVRNQHIHKKRRHRHNRSINWLTTMGRKFVLISFVKINSVEIPSDLVDSFLSKDC